MWALYIAIITASGGATSSVVPFADEKACIDGRDSFTRNWNAMPAPLGGIKPASIAMCFRYASEK